MPVDALRMYVGFSIILSHLVSYGLILLGNVAMVSQEKVELSLIVSPIFSTYVAAIVRRISTLEATIDRAPTHPAFAILSIGSATIFSLAVPLVIYLFIANSITTFGELKNTVGILETALGLYTGAVIDRLFGGRGQAAPTEAAASH
jgi:uncharacterized membrane protein